MTEFKVADHESSFLPSGRDWKLVWHDEFDGSELDRSKWGFRLNFWHIAPAPFYTDQGVELRDGRLILRLVEENGVFKSPALQTGSLFYELPENTGEGFWPVRTDQSLPRRFLHRFGYYEIFCRPPRKPGWWSAFWLQSPCIGAHPDARYGGVECDIMESQNFAVSGSFKAGNIYNGYGCDAVNPGHCHWTPENRNNGWFRFGMDWTPDGYTFYCDGVKVHFEGPPVSLIPQFILLTTEPVGSRRNQPDPRLKDALGDTFEVDYVRVFSDRDGESAAFFSGRAGDVQTNELPLDYRKTKE